MSIREETIHELESQGFVLVGTVDGRAHFRNGSKHVKLPPGNGPMTPEQRDACLRNASGGKGRKKPAGKRASAAARKRAQECARIEAEIARREHAIFGPIADELTGEQKRDVRRRLLENDASYAATLHVMTERPRVSERARHRA